MEAEEGGKGKEKWKNKRRKSWKKQEKKKTGRMTNDNMKIKKKILGMKVC